MEEKEFQVLNDDLIYVENVVAQLLVNVNREFRPKLINSLENIKKGIETLKKETEKRT